MKDHPVVNRLVELRTYLEKVRPVDKKMAYQVEKLLSAGARVGRGEGGAGGGLTNERPGSGHVI